MRIFLLLLIVAAVAMVSNAQEEDPILLPRELLRDVVRAGTHATGRDATFGMVCVNEQRNVRVPCAPDGIQLQRFPDGSVLLTLLHPDYHPLRASGRHVYIPPEPKDHRPGGNRSRVEGRSSEPGKAPRCAGERSLTVPQTHAGSTQEPHGLNERLLGSQIALFVGTVGILSGLAAVGREGASSDATGLMFGPVMVLGAAAYSSSKRRLLGLKPETMARKAFEAVCLLLLVIMWLGHMDLEHEIRNNPVSHMIIPLWALLAYLCAKFRTERYRVDALPKESWVKLRTFLWAAPIVLALLFAGFAALAAASAMRFRIAYPSSSERSQPAGKVPAGDRERGGFVPPQPADIGVLQGAGTLTCDFDDMPTSMVIADVNHNAEGFGNARLMGNVGVSDVLSVVGREVVSFIEFPANAVNAITVYPAKNGEGRFLAVYSRHTAVLGWGNPSPSQQRGTCRVLE